MSIQEDKLRAIADAIRQKEGSSGLIPASDFAARILALNVGGGGSCGPSIEILSYDEDMMNYTGRLLILDAALVDASPEITIMEGYA